MVRLRKALNPHCVSVIPFTAKNCYEQIKRLPHFLPDGILPFYDLALRVLAAPDENVGFGMLLKMC